MPGLTTRLMPDEDFERHEQIEVMAVIAIGKRSPAPGSCLSARARAHRGSEAY